MTLVAEPQTTDLASALGSAHGPIASIFPCSLTSYIEFWGCLTGPEETGRKHWADITALSSTKGFSSLLGSQRTCFFCLTFWEHKSSQPSFAPSRGQAEENQP